MFELSRTTRTLNVILAGTVGLSALAGAAGCEKLDSPPPPDPSVSPYDKCSGLPAVERVEGGFVVGSCSVELYNPKDPYNQWTNPNGVKSDELILDKSPGEPFGVTCLQLEGMPTQAIIPTYNSKTAQPVLGAVNLTPRSSDQLQQEDIPACTPGMFESTPMPPDSTYTNCSASISLDRQPKGPAEYGLDAIQFGLKRPDNSPATVNTEQCVYLRGSDGSLNKFGEGVLVYLVCPAPGSNPAALTVETRLGGDGQPTQTRQYAAPADPAEVARLTADCPK